MHESLAASASNSNFGYTISSVQSVGVGFILKAGEATLVF